MVRGRLVLLAGKAGSGKTTAAAHLRRRGFVEVNFADPLKDCLAVLFQWPRDVLGAATPEMRRRREALPKRVYNNVEYDYRLAAKFLGTEVGREQIDPNLWVIIARLKIEALLAEGRDVVVSDAQFPNEIDMGLELDGVCFLMAHRGEHLIPDRDEHESERAFFERAGQMTTLQTASIPEMEKRLDAALDLSMTTTDLVWLLLAIGALVVLMSYLVLRVGAWLF